MFSIMRTMIFLAFLLVFAAEPLNGEDISGIEMALSNITKRYNVFSNLLLSKLHHKDSWQESKFQSYNEAKQRYTQLLPKYEAVDDDVNKKFPLLLLYSAFSNKKRSNTATPIKQIFQEDTAYTILKDLYSDTLILPKNFSHNTLFLLALAREGGHAAIPHLTIDVNRPVSECSPFLKTLQQRVNLLNEESLNLDNIKLYTPLQVAVLYKNIPAIEEILKRNPQGLISAKSPDQPLALHCAVNLNIDPKDEQKMISLLLTEKDLVSIRDKNYQTPLHRWLKKKERNEDFLKYERKTLQGTLKMLLENKNFKKYDIQYLRDFANLQNLSNDPFLTELMLQYCDPAGDFELLNIVQYMPMNSACKQLYLEKYSWNVEHNKEALKKALEKSIKQNKGAIIRSLACDCHVPILEPINTEKETVLHMIASRGPSSFNMKQILNLICFCKSKKMEQFITTFLLILKEKKINKHILPKPLLKKILYYLPEIPYLMNIEEKNPRFMFNFLSLKNNLGQMAFDIVKTKDIDYEKNSSLLLLDPDPYKGK